jgi:Helix-turn-helix domain
MDMPDDMPWGEELSDTWYTPNDVLELMKIKESTLKKWRKYGLIFLKIDGTLRCNKVHLHQFLRRYLPGGDC